MIRKLLVILIALVLYGCSEENNMFSSEAEGSVTNYDEDLHGTYASTYAPLGSENIVIRNATVFDGDGNKFHNYEHSPTHLVFDHNEKNVVGLQVYENNEIQERVRPLTKEDLNNCLKYGFPYILPEMI